MDAPAHAGVSLRETSMVDTPRPGIPHADGSILASADISSGRGRTNALPVDPRQRACAPARRMLIAFSHAAKDRDRMPESSTPNGESARAAAIGHLRREHRALAKVIDGLQTLVAEMTEQTVAVDFELLSAMLYYVDAFPERLHHPKEDRHLFSTLLRRDPGSAELVAQLAAEHERSPAVIGALESALVRWQGGAPDGLERFAEALQTFCDFHWGHMRREEEELLPRAEQALTASDWEEIADAFSANDDPLFGANRRHHFERLYQRIANLAPRKLRLSLKAAARNPL